MGAFPKNRFLSFRRFREILKRPDLSFVPSCRRDSNRSRAELNDMGFRLWPVINKINELYKLPGKWECARNNFTLTPIISPHSVFIISYLASVKV